MKRILSWCSVIVVLFVQAVSAQAQTAEIEKAVAELFNRYPDRFLFGTDNVAPKDQETQLRVFHLWDRIFDQLTPEASYAIRRGNYERLFDAARMKVRAWEREHVR